MPKMKTRSAAAKRFKKSHILNKKTRKRKRNLRKQTEIDASNVKQMKRCMPYM